MYQNVTIGGQTPDKKDAVNKLSFLVLKSVAQTRLPQPNLTVRYYNGLNKEFLDECIEVMKLSLIHICLFCHISNCFATHIIIPSKA